MEDDKTETEERDTSYHCEQRITKKQGIQDSDVCCGLLGEFSSHEVPPIKTLGDSIRYFRLSSLLDKLEMSLEDVRRNKKEKKQHQDYFHKIDKQIQKLSLNFHPDRNNRGTEEEKDVVKNLQAALNATRTALRLLNTEFLEDISTYHGFGFYTNLRITSVCDEEKMKHRICEVMNKITVISRIKQKNIILEIRQFLISSSNCIRSYERNDFSQYKMYRYSSLHHLRGCIEGFQNFCLKLGELKEEYKHEKNDKTMLDILEKMENDGSRNLKILQLLYETAKTSLNGRYRFFFTSEHMDPYFVLPLVYCMNVILMCNAMKKEISIFEKLFTHLKLTDFRSDNCKVLDYLENPCYLTFYYTGNIYYKEKALNCVRENRSSREEVCNREITKKDIKSEFNICIQQVSRILESKFKVDNYNTAVKANSFALDLKKLMTIIEETQKEREEALKESVLLQKKTEKMSNLVDEILYESRELKKLVQEKLELGETAENKG